mgnify:CR=1 FL=1
MSLGSVWKARRPVVMVLVIVAFIYIGFQLIVDLGWLTLDELIRYLAGIAGVVAVVILTAFLGAFVLIRRGAKPRAESAGRWQQLNNQKPSDQSGAVKPGSIEHENNKG